MNQDLILILSIPAFYSTLANIGELLMTVVDRMLTHAGLEKSGLAGVVDQATARVRMLTARHPASNNTIAQASRVEPVVTTSSMRRT